MTRTGAIGAAAVAAVLLAVGTVRPAAAGEEATIKAFAAWQGQGQAIQTGPDEATFFGAFAGTVYVDTDKGPVDAGQMVCPASVRINLKDGTQAGTGRCTIKGKDGAMVFADMSCQGVHLVGCEGDFTLTGGTARFSGITGGGRFTMRSSLREVTGMSTEMVQESATGIIFWPALHYVIP